MATPLTTTRFNSALKTLFPEKKLRMYNMEEQPFVNYVPKAEDFFGRNGEVPIQYSPSGAGSSHTFEDAQQSKGSALYTHFVVTRKRDYKLISIDAEALEASQNDKGAYLEAIKAETEAALANVNQQLGADMQSNGDGKIGAVVSVNAGANTFVVGEGDIVHFEPGAVLQAAASPFVALRPGQVGYVVVSAVNFDSNTITVDPAQGDSLTAYGLTAADRVYPKGNFGLSITGTEGWVPTDRTNLATPFNNVTRSVFPSRLAGIYFDGSSYGLAESLERALARGAKERSFPTECWVNYNRFQDLSLELGAKALREPYGVGGFAYDSIIIHGGGRKVRVVADQNFADTSALLTTKESWKFWTLKAAPRFLTKELGSEMIIEPAHDGYEVRIGWRGELVCRSPKDNIRMTLPT